MEFCRLQIGCLVVILYIAFIYFRESRLYHRKEKNSLFEGLLILGTLSIIFDGVTAYTVNHTETVPEMLNTLLHTLFLIGIDSVIFALFLYMLRITDAYPKKDSSRLLINIPFVINVVLVVVNIGSLEYRHGVSTNYSMGVSAYMCFIMAIVYIAVSVAVFFKRWNYIESRKRMSIFTYMLVVTIVTVVQTMFPETLITSVAVLVIILGIYMNSENPVLGEIAHYHSEMVMSFANLIEQRDNNTGGHIKRTSRYVELIAKELRKRGEYRNIITKDYITRLTKAAPMHDIGKVSVPDSILKKPGKLTDEEFATMKLHAENGGKIITEIFENLGDKEYLEMAYEVARYHHEKWNGRGYPEGLKEKEIPLCARIMAVADVFDAVSEKRCYREAMPLDKCFSIIEEGSGRDFDPLIAEVFLDMRDRIEEVHKSYTENMA